MRIGRGSAVGGLCGAVAGVAGVDVGVLRRYVSWCVAGFYGAGGVCGC